MAAEFFWRCPPIPPILSRQLNETASLPHPDRDRTLVEACHDLAGRLRPSGPDGEIDEWSIYDESLRLLVRWAEESGCFFEDLQPLKEGGREHDLTFSEEGQTWLKFTKPAAAAYVVSFESGTPSLEPALPLEYLERLVLQNEIFADRVSFVGIAGERFKPRIVTRQPHIPGEAATPGEIVHLMTAELEFRQLPERFSVGYADSLAFLRDELRLRKDRRQRHLIGIDAHRAPLQAPLPHFAQTAR